MAKPKKSAVSENETALQSQAQPREVPQVGAPAGYTIKRQITVPSLVIKNAGQSFILRIDTAMETSKVITKDADGNPQKPAIVCDVTDVMTGENFRLLVGKVVEKNLQESYPDNGYVGKVFQITCKGKRKENQKYKDFSILELEKE